MENKSDTEKELADLKAAHVALAQQSAEQHAELTKYAPAIEQAKRSEHIIDVVMNTHGKSWHTQIAKFGGK